jgi:hypothetical protein
MVDEELKLAALIDQRPRASISTSRKITSL